MTGRTWDPGSDQTEFRWHRWLAVGEDDDTSLIARLRPAEGWLSIPLVLLLSAVVAWSIADAKWVLGNDALTSYLVWVGPVAAFWGYLSSRLELPRWAAHTIGAVIGALVLSITVGFVIAPSAANPKIAFDATAHSVAEAYLDLAWRHHLTTTEFGHFCLVLGILVWGTAQAAAYDVFGHKRAVSGVLLLGVVLVANMSLTIRDQFGALVIFSAGALALLLQSHAADERSTWLRHRIWRARETEVPHLQGGFAFASIAVVGSLLLTSVASSAPLANAWPGLSGQLQDIAVQFGHFLPPSGGGRLSGAADFADTQPINSVFVAQDGPVFQVVVQGDDAFHWRMAVYDKFSSTGWEISQGSKTTDVAAGAAIASGLQDALPTDAQGRRKVRVEIRVQDGSIRRLIAPNEPLSVDAPTQVTSVGGPTAAHLAWATTGAKTYTVEAQVPLTTDPRSGMTENALRAAGTGYPPGLASMYTQGKEFVGNDGKNLLKEILASSFYTKHALDNPYDIAKAIESYLSADPGEHANGFQYNENISGIMAQCTGLSTVDCFARFRQGFCQQYATTMTMLLRMEGIPARYAQGYLPGTPNETRVWQVTRRQQHAWVEAFFPGYGWVEFDPTGGGHSAVTPLVEGPAVTPRPSQSAGTFDPNATRRPATRPPEPEGPNGAGTTGGGNGPVMLVLGGLGLLGAVLLLFVVLRRRPPRIEPPDAVYRSIVRLASWLGYRPLPTQTVYEYAGMLGRVVPAAQPELDVVAVAKVETTYARRELPHERLELLARAREKLRWALVRLAFRRPRKRRRRGGRPGR